MEDYGKSLVVRSLGVLIAQGYSLTAYCYDLQRCGHSVKLDLTALAERLGPDHGIMHSDLVPKLRCSRCGGKDIGLRLSPPTGAPGRPFRPKNRTGSTGNPNG